MIGVVIRVVDCEVGVIDDVGVDVFWCWIGGGNVGMWGLVMVVCGVCL